MFKMTKNGLIVCNNKFVKIRDDIGYVNYIGKEIKFKEDDLLKAI